MNNKTPSNTEIVLTTVQAEFDAVPSYFERYQNQRDDEPYLVIVGHCSACGHWHDPMEDCPVMMEA